MFIDDPRPRATTRAGNLQSSADWQLEETRVEQGASIGSAAVVLGALRIGSCALVGAGAVVTRDVPAGRVVTGNPARVQAITRARHS